MKFIRKLQAILNEESLGDMLDNVEHGDVDPEEASEVLDQIDNKLMHMINNGEVDIDEAEEFANKVGNVRQGVKHDSLYNKKPETLASKLGYGTEKMDSAAGSMVQALANAGESSQPN